MCLSKYGIAGHRTRTRTRGSNSLSGTMSPTARFGKTHFVRWDNVKTGGRWYECAIAANDLSDGSRAVVAHEGSTGNFKKSEISHLGVRSSLGDTVIAYWYGGRDYAFKGRHAGNHENGQIWVEYDDGDKVWVDAKYVYKLSPIS